MAKFGFYSASGKEPLQEYEGDCLVVNDDVVRILIRMDGSGNHDVTVAAVRLAEGQSVKKVP
jgi:hypothetical protein